MSGKIFLLLFFFFLTITLTVVLIYTSVYDILQSIPLLNDLVSIGAAFRNFVGN